MKIFFCIIDESITPFYNMIHQLLWWVDKKCDEYISFHLQ